MSHSKVFQFFVLALIALGITVAACHRETTSHERYYQLKGTVVSVDLTNKQIVVNHEAIPGFMAAMAMPYPVKDDAALRQLRPGDQITARVVVTPAGAWLDRIVIVKTGSRKG